MQAAKASYEPFNDKFVILYGDKSQYEAIVQGTLQGKWYKRLNAFLIPKNNEERLQNLLLTLENSAKFDEMEKRIKSRKDQKRYHREISGDEYSSESESGIEEEVEAPKKEFKNSRRRNREKREKSTTPHQQTISSPRRRQRPNVALEGNVKPRSRRLYREKKKSVMVSKDLLLASESSDTSADSSSDSDFPEAEDPRDIEKEHKLHLSRMRRMKRRDAMVKRK